MILTKIDRLIAKIESYLLTLLILGMILFAGYQVIARNWEILHRFFEFFYLKFGTDPSNSGFIQKTVRMVASLNSHFPPLEWGDALSRNLVLWLGFIGASVAAQEGGHLSIDFIGHFTPNWFKKYSGILTSLASSIVCYLLMLAAYKFFQDEKLSEEFLIPEKVPMYWASAIIPFGFLMMTIRYGIKIFENIHLLFKEKKLGFVSLADILATIAGLSLFIPHKLGHSLLPKIEEKVSLWMAGLQHPNKAMAVFTGLIALLGSPLFVIFGAISLFCFHQVGTDSSAIIIEMNRLASAPALTAIPLFTFAGYLIAESKSPERLIGLFDALFGWVPGGLAFMTIILCAFFTAFTGASGVTIIALGGILYPILVKEKYPDNFSMGLVTTCGSVGLMFPPSLPLILYGLVSGASIDMLFKAGILPGALIVGVLGLYGFLVSAKHKVPRTPFSITKLKSAIFNAKWEIPLPMIVLIGIYGGFITASEAAAVTALYVLLTQLIIYRDLKIHSDIPRIAKQSMVLVGTIIVIFAVAMGFTSYLVDQQVPNQIFEWIRQYIHSKWAFLIALNVFLLIVGFLMDIFSALIVVVPLILPIANEFGVDPIHLGIIFLTNLEIGYLHPPVGLNLLLSSIRFKKSILHLAWVTLPYLLLLILCLLIITYVPALSLFWVK